MDPFDEYEPDEEAIALRVLKLLEAHGWEFSHCRDPVLILIELEDQTDELGEDEP